MNFLFQDIKRKDRMENTGKGVKPLTQDFETELNRKKNRLFCQDENPYIFWNKNRNRTNIYV